MKRRRLKRENGNKIIKEKKRKKEQKNEVFVRGNNQTEYENDGD